MRLQSETVRVAGRRVGLLMLITLVSACSSRPAETDPFLAPVYEAYHRGDYDHAYVEARQIAASSSSSRAQQARYVAGLAAYQLGDLSAAERELGAAANSTDRRLAADALATLGLVYVRQDRQRQAAGSFERSAALLVGQDKANAYLQAGIAWQKLGRWAQARANFMLARSHSSDPVFRHRVAEQLSVSGFTLQLGFFTVQANAFKAAHRISDKAVRHRLGYPRVLPATDVTGRKGYLVQVGRFSSYATAAMAKRELAAVSAMVVPMSR